MIKNLSYFAQRLSKSFIKKQASSNIMTLRYYILQDSKRLRTRPIIQENPIPKISKELFKDELMKIIVRIQSAFQKMQQFNNTDIKSIKIEYVPMCKVSIQTSHGVITIQGSQDETTLYYISPFSGVYKYYYCQQNQRWFSNKDKHIFQQNLAREVMYKFRGVLEI